MPAESETPVQTFVETPGGIIVGTDPKPTPVQQTQTPAADRFTAEDIAKARAEEKSKLYPQIEELKAGFASLKAERDAEKKAREDEEQRLVDEKARIDREKIESETDLRTLMQQKQQEFEDRLAEEAKQREAAFALLDREREYNALQDYLAQRKHEVQDTVMPELFDLITGNTQEEIEASITSYQDRTMRILESVQQATSAARQNMPGVSSRTPGAGPTETNTDNRTYTAADLAAMSMTDYAKIRPKLLSQAAQGRSSGMFGS